VKITKDTLKQLIKEELAELQEQTMSLPGEEGGRQLEVPKSGPTQTPAPRGLGVGKRGVNKTALTLRDIKSIRDDMESLSTRLNGLTNHFIKGMGFKLGQKAERDPDLDRLMDRAMSVANDLAEVAEDLELDLISQAARYELREESDTLGEMIREEIEAVLAEINPEQDAPGLKGHSEREANRKASCKAWKAQGKSLPDWCDDYI
jgi:hypothetical protein